MVWAATDAEDIARLAVHFLVDGPANRGFDVHLPGGITAADICRATGSVTGRPVQYQEAPSTRAAVEPYPISDAHKEMYVELFDYFAATPYLGEPGPIEEAVNDFEYSTVEDFMRFELFAATVAAPTRGVGPGTTSGRSSRRPTPEEVRQ